MLTDIIEAIIFASGKGISKRALVNGLRDYNAKDIEKALEELEKRYSGEERGVRLIRFNDSYQFETNPAYGGTLSDILMETKERELSKTLLQVLAIIAYKQPVTRLEIEDLRGVGSDYVLGMLTKLGLIDVVGRKETLGRPLLYGTTDEFLKKFGLHSLEDLPDYDELMRLIRENFDKYYKTASLYRERDIDDSEPDIGLIDVDERIDRIDRVDEVAAADADGTGNTDDEFFGEDSDDTGFMSGDDYIEIE